MLSGPEQSAESLGGFFEARTTARFDHTNELLVDLVQHRLCKHTLFLGLWAERIHEALVFTGRHQAALYAQLLHQTGKTEAIHQHANAAHHTGFVHVNFVGPHGNVVGRRSAGFLHYRVQRLLVQSLQPQNFIVDDASLHRTATRRVDQQNHRLRALVFKRAAHGSHHQLCTGFGTRRNFALNFDQRGMGAGVVCRRTTTVHAQHDDHRDQHQPCQANAIAPAACAALLLQRRHGQLLQRSALPTRSGLRTCYVFSSCLRTIFGGYSRIYL